MARLALVTLHLAAAIALIAILAPSVWMGVTNDIDPRGRLGGYFIVLHGHSTDETVFVRTPSGGEHTFRYGTAIPCLFVILILWAAVVINRKLRKDAATLLADRLAGRRCAACDFDIRA